MRLFFRKSISNCVALFLVATQVSCINVLREFGDKSSDSYLLEQARRLLDAEDFDAAIEAITPVLASEPENEEVVYVAAASYAGRAGLRALDLLTNIVTYGSEKTLFEIFAEAFPGADADDQTDIERATSIIDTFSDEASGRSSDLNLFSVFVYYSRIGVALSLYAYDSEGVQRTNFSACHTEEDFEGVKTGLPDDMVDIVMTSIPKIVDALSGVTVQGGAVDALRNVDLTDSLSEDPIPCSDDSNNPVCLIMRSAINVGLPDGFGLGTGSQFLESPSGLCAITTP
jgi:hypothetical protein